MFGWLWLLTNVYTLLDFVNTQNVTNTTSSNNVETLVVFEGDTSLEMYFNGFPINVDTMQQLMWVNGQKTHTVKTTNIKAARISSQSVLSYQGKIVPGDVIAFKAQNRKAAFLTVEGPHSDIVLPGLGGFIASLSDGTMTNSQWRCLSGENSKVPDGWNSRSLDDSSWPFAEEQSDNCCPWRDKDRAWQTMNAKWIWAAGFGNSSSAYCRYTKQKKYTDEPNDGSLKNASDTKAPGLNIIEVTIGTSYSRVLFTVTEDADVACDLVDSRFELRAPTALELLKNAGGDLLRAKANTYAWTDTGTNRNQEYTLDAIKWGAVNSMEECKRMCEQTASPEKCQAISYYDAGARWHPGNCKLMTWPQEKDLNETVSSGMVVMHSNATEVPTENSLGLQAMLLPGAEYHTYCAAFNPITGFHSSWDAVKATKIVKKTKGCFDCGMTAFPTIGMLGGWATMTKINVLVNLDKAGDIYCMSRVPNSVAPLLTAQEIKDSPGRGSNKFLTGGMNGIVQIADLQPSFSYEVLCAAIDVDGQPSPAEEIQKYRRVWSTSQDPVPIIVQNVGQEVQGSELKLTVILRLSDPGTIFCWARRSIEVQSLGVPISTAIMTKGFGTRVYKAFEDKDLVILGLNPKTEYETYCSARKSSGAEVVISDLITPYPVVKILEGQASYRKIELLVSIDRKGNTTCRAFPWQMVPTVLRAVPPQVREEVASGPSNVIMRFAGLAKVNLYHLQSGTFYDVFCYAEDITVVGQVFKYKMDLDAVLQTRMKFKTNGPRLNSAAWTCVTGTTCNITGMAGTGLSNRDRVLVRRRPCRGSCYCSGEEDPLRKGAFCAAVSQDPIVKAVRNKFEVNPAERDPRGEWCYVRSGNCPDEENSVVYPELALSYQACEEELDPTVLAEMDGFPELGLSKFAEDNGRNFRWNGILMVKGGHYHLCWCDGTAASCDHGLHFHLALGTLHVSGPSPVQQSRHMSCVSGMGCGVEHFKGHALADGARLLAIPDTEDECFWWPIVGQTPGAVGFPDEGITGPATDGGRTYRWQAEKILAPGGVYRLCWCGADDPECNRRVQGVSFLISAGTLEMIGPYFSGEYKQESICYFATSCSLSNTSGQGLGGGDRVMVLQECGLPAQKPRGWTDSSELQLPTYNWTSMVGWLVQGPQPAAAEIYEATLPSGSFFLEQGQGVFGFPNNGVSVRSAKPGHYAWKRPVLAAVGKYQLCWCSKFSKCVSPSDFLIPFGEIELHGPLVYPRAAQTRVCVGARQCTILNMQGILYPGDQLLIADKECGGPPARGVPNAGMSVFSEDGHAYSWGSIPINAVGGEYRLCWCSRKMDCSFPQHYKIFAGILRIKRVVLASGNFEPALLGLQLGRHMAAVPDDLDVLVATALSVDVSRVVVVKRDLDGSRLLHIRVICAVLEESAAIAERWPELLKQEPLQALVPVGSAFNESSTVLIFPYPLPPKRFFCYLDQPCVVTGIRGISLSGRDKAMAMATCGVGEGSVGFPKGGLAQTLSGGTSYAWQSVPGFAGMHRICWCAAESFCMAGTDHVDDIGELIVGGPLPDIQYDCYVRQPCWIDDLQDSGAIKQGDRLRISPAEQECGSRATAAFGFPNDGISSPAKEESNFKYFSWGKEELWAKPGSYRLCWCSAENFGGSCEAGEAAMFDAPAGMLRVGTERDHFMEKIFPGIEQDKELNEMWYLMVFPLPFLCICYICYSFRPKKLKVKIKLGMPDVAIPKVITVKSAPQPPKQDLAPSIEGADLRVLRQAMREDEEDVDRYLAATQNQFLQIEDLGNSIKNSPLRDDKGNIRELPSTSWALKEAWAQPAPLAIQGPNRGSIISQDPNARLAIEGPNRGSIASQRPNRRSVTGSLPPLLERTSVTSIVEAETTLRPLPPQPEPPPLSPSENGFEGRLLQVMDL